MPDTVQQLRIEAEPERVSVFRAGSQAPILVQNAPRDLRPFIHPIAVPGGSGSVTENAPDHHPWQHGLYVGLNEVNGVGFWTEGLSPQRVDLDGTFHPQIVGTPDSNGNTATWTVVTEHRDPQGDTLFHETQQWTVTDLGEQYELDLVWVLRADQALTFGEYPYGGLFLRMPFRRETGGTAFNSAGQQGGETEGQRAKWVAVQMLVPDNSGEVLVAVLDHPSNLEHPVPWRVDNELGINPSVSIAGDWTIPAGGERVFRHRLVVSAAPIEASQIDEAWASFTEEA
jgi:hypothetical protein